MSIYNPNTPQANEDPADSQAYFLANFSLLNSIYTVNHNPFTSTTYPGYHKKINFPGPLAADPNLATPQMSLYPKAFLDSKTGTSSNELFFQNGNALGNVKQITNLAVYNGIITNVTQANPAQVTSANHGLTTGDVIRITGVYGMVNLNGNTYTITVVDGNNFTLNATNSTLYPAYVPTSGGWFRTSTAMTRYGFITPWGLTFNMGLTATQTTYYAVPPPGGFTTLLAMTVPGPATTTFIPNPIQTINATDFVLKTAPFGTDNFYYLVIQK